MYIFHLFQQTRVIPAITRTSTLLTVPRTAVTASAVPTTTQPKFVIVTPNTRPGTPVSTVNQPSPTPSSVVSSGATPTLVKIVTTPSVSSVLGKPVTTSAPLSKLVVLQASDETTIKSEPTTPVQSRPGTPDVAAYVSAADGTDHS